MLSSDYPILGAEIAGIRKRFYQRLLIIKPTTMTQSVETSKNEFCMLYRVYIGYTNAQAMSI